MRAVAAWGWSALRDEDEVSARLAHALSDSVWWVRRNAALALTCFTTGERTPIQVLSPCTREQDLLVLQHRLGVTEVFSLLDPNLPLEGALLREEERLAKKLGFAFRNIPVAYLKMDDPATRERLYRRRNNKTLLGRYGTVRPKMGGLAAAFP